MADSQLSDLPSAGALDGTELVYLDQANTSVKALLSVIKTFFFSVPAPEAGRLVTAAGGVTVTAADNVIVIAKTIAASTAVSVNPATLPLWQPITIKDGKGDAATNVITITPTSGTIDGAAFFATTFNRQWVTFINTGAELSIIG